ncbi:LysR family transcriptional regulator [Paraburkholderia fungorum]|uniref:LysR family transcriptional regulator n=1 Tax=Paraburkholderia fungorum TaxID=134537 RepID=UPI001C1EC6B1|nr:LysR family transcriptional regulator [Paraburkholderia fungorum]MBU7440226.1 LysR family transcriptional regulator [Paraburkholderia fungorum]
MDRLQNMRVFLSVVEAGSFTIAAQRAKISLTRTSRSVADLEAQVRARLLDRTTRRVALTEVGERYLQRCERILAYVEEAEAEASSTRAFPKGKLRVHAMTSIGVHYVVPAIRGYQSRYPKVTIDLTLSPRIPDLVDEGYDVSIVLGNRMPDSGVAAQLLGRAFSVLCASPAYVAKHGIPLKPADLANHVFLHMMTVKSSQNELTLEGPRGIETVALQPASLQVNDAGALATAVREGMGIAILPTYTVAASLMSGDIVRVMPDYATLSTNVYALYPSLRYPDAKIRTWTNFLRDHPPEALMADQAAPSELTMT